MEPFSGLWADLRKSGGLPKKGVLMSTCEAELTQLMQQIDVMVQAKRTEWNQERQVLQAKLDVREHECLLVKGTMDQKHQEIGQLRCQVEASEREKRDIVEAYERQLRSLKSEVGTMRKEYEKLKKQYRRFAQQEKNKALTEVESSSSELRKLSKKLDDYRQKTKEWEHQKRNFLKEIEVLESERKMVADKCELVQQQSSGYQTQLDKRRDMLDSTELTLRSQITQLEGQLSRARDTISGQDSQLAHLKTTLEEILRSQRQTLEEKEAAEDALKRAHSKVRQLETELARCQSELEAENAHAHVADAATEQLVRSNEELEKKLFEKDAAIKKIKQSIMQEQHRMVAKLREEIDVLLTENQKSKKAERFFRDEVAGLREKLDASRQDCEQLNEQMAVKLEDQLTRVRKSSAHEVEQLQTEVAELSADLQRRNIALTSLSEHLAGVEQTIKHQEEQLAKMSAAVQVANAQLEALRLESRHLRKSALQANAGCTDGAENQLKELQAAYASSLGTLEDQNRTLQQDVTSLRSHMARLKGESSRSVESTIRKTEQVFDKVKDKEQRRLVEQRRSAEQRAVRLEEQLADTETRYEVQISQLRTEITALQDSLHSRGNALKRKSGLGLEHDAMTHFVGGVEEVVQRQPHRDTSLLNTSRSSPLLTMQAERDDHLHHLVLDPVETVTEKFLLQQEERTRELERKLDQHIEGLKINMEDSNRKLLNER